jgi:hypothetical protein
MKPSCAVPAESRDPSFDRTSAAVIRRAQGLRDAGMGLNAIARALSEGGHLSRVGTPFVAMQISRWLRRNSA